MKFKSAVLVVRRFSGLRGGVLLDPLCMADTGESGVNPVWFYTVLPDGKLLQSAFPDII